jgi:hypothetical protein
MNSKIGLGALFLTVGLALGVACGDETDTDPGKAGDPGKVAIDAGAPAAAAGTLLAPNTAGKACAAAPECGPSGACATKLTGGFLGQADEAPKGYCTAACSSDAQCGAGSVCLGALTIGGIKGECRKGCKADADCGRAEYECAMQAGAPTDAQMAGGMSFRLPNTCQPRVTPAKLTSEVGKACASNAECGAGTCETGEDYPGGYCSGACVADADCGGKGVCLKDGYGSGGSCFERCTADTDCARDASGYGCVDIGAESKICAPKADPLPAGIVGKACTANTECATGTCAAEVGLPAVPAPGGYCSVTGCDGDDKQCGAGGECVTTQYGSRCYKGCTADTDCRTGYSCTQRGMGEYGAKVCFPTPTGDAGVAAPAPANVPASDAGTFAPNPARPDAG